MNILHYLQRDWVLGEYECWALVCEFYAREFGIELPLINLGSDNPKAVRQAFGGNSDVHKQFEVVAVPSHGCVVAMGKRWLSHVGIYLQTPDGPRILHCRKGPGALCQPVADVEQYIPILGYHKLKGVVG